MRFIEWLLADVQQQQSQTTAWGSCIHAAPDRTVSVATGDRIEACERCGRILSRTPVDET
ncbi:hypothetical protein [Haloparvum sedimenti]|uniref:hypothetical protein n=1 Tax=Haloparvum sedimenti TaxID=1678448 RepID=UPI000F7946B4|nr:hypothetical protein [Haloparvum sedimenti]